MTLVQRRFWLNSRVNSASPITPSLAWPGFGEIPVISDPQAWGRACFNNGMHIAASASRGVIVPASPEAVAAYFSRNESLLARLVPGRVHRLEDGLYRVSLRTFEALGLAVRPVLEVRFTDLPTHTVMEAEKVRAVEGPSGLSLDVEFTGVARFEPHPEGCEIRCEASAAIGLGLPFPFNLLPERLLESAATAVLAAAMDSTAGRFEHLIRDDFTPATRKAA